MEPLSFFSIVNAIKYWSAAILKKLGYKFLRNDDFINEELEVDFNFPNKSPECIKEKGAEFRWSEKHLLTYEKYFQLEGNTRRYFKMKKNYLWIKRK
ncbi:MAG TPA: hypothetical protein VNC84_06610 [Gammaproteobacteria bacterium]|jgi:hypothetical protein|nr:hypothetical protein [Gammaproteobacteria bacterium]